MCSYKQCSVLLCSDVLIFCCVVSHCLSVVSSVVLSAVLHVACCSPCSRTGRRGIGSWGGHRCGRGERRHGANAGRHLLRVHRYRPLACHPPLHQEKSLLGTGIQCVCDFSGCWTLSGGVSGHDSSLGGGRSHGHVLRVGGAVVPDSVTLLTTEMYLCYIGVKV